MANPGDGRSRRQPKAETRQMLLETGRRLLVDRGLPHAVEVRLTEVLAEHSLTTGAAYQIWGSQQDFQEDLALYMASRFGWSKVEELLDEADFDHDDPLGTVRRMGRRYFDGFVAGNDFFAALRLWATGGPPDDLRQAVASGYRTVQVQIEELIEAFFAVSGLQMREPFLPADLAISWTALTEGFALRLRFDAGAVEPTPEKDLLAESMVAVFRHYVDLEI